MLDHKNQHVVYMIVGKQQVQDVNKVWMLTMLLKIKKLLIPRKKLSLQRKLNLHRRTQITNYLESVSSTAWHTKAQVRNEDTEERAAGNLSAHQPILPSRTNSHILGPHDRAFYERWKSLIYDHFPEPDLSVAKLAKLSCLSQRQLFNKVKQITGLSPKNWLNEFRIKFAKNLLRTEAINISQIAEESGFSTASNFSKTFRKLAGMTPSAYRREVIKNGDRGNNL